MNPRFMLAAAAALALAACSRSEAPSGSAGMSEASQSAAASTSAPADAPSAPPRPSASAGSTIPEALRGEWASSAAECGRADEGRLRIGPDAVTFYESEGAVTRVVMQNAREASVELRLSGEGETWTDARRFRLSEDGRTLTDLSGPTPFPRVRCPAG